MSFKAFFLKCSLDCLPESWLCKQWRLTFLLRLIRSKVDSIFWFLQDQSSELKPKGGKASSSPKNAFDLTSWAQHAKPWRENCCPLAQDPICQGRRPPHTAMLTSSLRECLLAIFHAPITNDAWSIWQILLSKACSVQESVVKKKKNNQHYKCLDPRKQAIKATGSHPASAGNKASLETVNTRQGVLGSLDGGELGWTGIWTVLEAEPSKPSLWKVLGNPYHSVCQH